MLMIYVETDNLLSGKFEIYFFLNLPGVYRDNVNICVKLNIVPSDAPKLETGFKLEFFILYFVCYH